MPHWWCRDVVSNLFSQSLALTTVGHYLVLAVPLVPSPCNQREGNVNYLNFVMLKKSRNVALTEGEMKLGHCFHLMH